MRLMGVNFTEEQLDVINIRNSNVLVSAAAGSGKTAVLVERIIRMILDEENGTDIDRLLVVTFTEAAAGEMKDRISAAIDEQLSLNPENIHLQKQAALVHRARISTIHSFCLDVIRNYFNLIGLDPAFRIADENELKMLEEDVLDEIMENHHAEDDGIFHETVDCFSHGSNDREIRDYVLKIYNFAQGYPWPSTWLDRCVQQYKITNVTEFNDAYWVVYLLNNIKSRLEDVTSLVLDAIRIAGSIGGPKGYISVLEKDLAKINELKNFSSYDDLYDLISAFKFDRIPPKAGEDVDDELKEKVKSIRDRYKKMVTDSANNESIRNLVKGTSEEEMAKLNKMAPYIETLINLVNEFSGEYAKKRRAKGIISFNDMEHYALDILCTEENGKFVPSNVAREYQSSIDEILMDEYQDCNRVQEMIIRCVSKEDTDEVNNLFMVGDVKQSIYKFRLANPELFINKYNSYFEIDHDGQQNYDRTRINLHKNFRSRPEVINTVNNLFGQIMDSDIGNVVYDQDAHLVKGADYPPNEECNSEYLIAVNDGEDDVAKGELEARLIAGKIKKLRRTFKVTDKATGKLRPLMYKDIVILVRSMTDVAKGIKEVFAEEGIPAVISLSNGFYQTKEVQQVIQFLKIVDNPRQDIPMYGSLVGYFGKFSDEEVAGFRVNYLKSCESDNETDSESRSVTSKESFCLYDCIKAEKNNAKVKAFLDLLEEFRAKSKYTPIHQIISELIGERTGYANHMAAQRAGAQRKANLNMLILKANDYESTSYRGLFNFNRYIEKIKKYGNDVGEADIVDENADVVKVMTIHKSKGLEFPVCILAGTHKKFNTMDISKTISIDMDYGIGLGYINVNKRIRNSTLMLNTINLKMKQDLLGEELRVLYVALTRAKEKLIITGVTNSKEDTINNSLARFETSKDGKMLFCEKSRCASYMDFMSSLAKDAQFEDSETLIVQNEMEDLSVKDTKGMLIDTIASCDTEGDLYKEFDRKFKEKYPHEELEDLILKTSVSDLKKAYLDTEFTKELFKANEPKEYIPEFIKARTDEISGTERGNAYHKVMELLDMHDIDVKSQINKMTDSGRLCEKYVQAIDVRKIEKFLKSELSHRMAVAQNNEQLKREQPFVLGLSADVLDKKYPDNETVLLQGIIDAFFIEDGEIVLVDYKTDVIKDADELSKRYKIQLDYYQEALERITGMPVKEKILYSFCLGEEVKVK